MNSLDYDYAAGIFNVAEPPCLSLYQPTHRRHPENQQDPIRFRNLLKTLEQSLRQKYAARDVRPLMEPFQSLAEDHEFWNHTLDGLAVLAAKGVFRAYRLQRPVAELAVVADSFHIKPLIRIVQSADRYQILGLNRQEIKLFEGNRDALDEIEPHAAIPRTITEALGADLKDPYLNVWTHGSGSGRAAVRFGQGSKADVVDTETERFFRAVDRAVLEHCSRASGLPLLLAALPEQQSLFRQISHNPFLLEEGIDIHPDAMPIETLRDRAWRAVEPRYLARSAALVDMFGAARPRGLSDDDAARITGSALAGRVATLLIEAGRIVPGRIDPATGAIELKNLADPEVDDLLDDVAELVLKNGGQVVVLPAERMPTQAGIAALYRF